MSNFAGPHNVPNKGKIAKVAHLFWSKKRAYHGEDVVLVAFTENVPDGTAMEIQIVPRGSNTVIDTIKGLTINVSQVTKKYTIAWKDKLPAKPGQEFVFKAVIGKLVSSESPVLLVDVEPPVLSA